ncbi:2OG-Fe(II) oxygenase [Paraflavitalea sp. CAU 1676]|uniref:2OG-Fe(II) oxygenase n=1 Tax=Paraflavitalea sp. CAU 1676 TaxID=3032598 RepID=UPI0023DCC877|nr:2OG-Fe(II) oxygenase [Paraflavitalea sp. CAU 1676]MDF2188504.1 2OG-Fe(II) oxygenase [Paraflavitalea sp. CAU 1676]
MPQKIEICHLLPDSSFTCFVIPALFSKAECEALLNENIRHSFQQAIANYPVYYRNNERQVVDDKALSAWLFEKVKPYLPETIRTNAAIESENGVWALAGLNDRLRFCKYSANQYFHRHLDGIHYQSAASQSKLTFMIYLNSATEFEGGRTLFYQTKEATKPWAEYIPVQGDLIVFDHNVWHEGEELRSGEKFVLRSDIIYSREEAGNSRQPFEAHLGYNWKVKMQDKDTILSGGRDKVINVWNKQGELLHSLAGHANSVLCIEKINDRIFVSGSRDQQIIVWERACLNGPFNLVRRISAHSAVVLTLCRLSDEHFASGGGDNLINICDVSGAVVQTLSGHAGWVWQVIHLQDDWIASCSEDSTVKIWNYRTGVVGHTFTLESPVICLSYDPATNRLAGGTLAGELLIMELHPGFLEKSRVIVKAHKGIIRTLLHIDSTHIASGGEDNLVKIWNIETGACIRELQHHNFVQSLELIGQETLLSSSYDGRIAVWPL